MILDKFYLLFKTDASGAASDIAGLDKQISQLAAKGKKRSEEENKELQNLRKLRKETTQDLKDQTRETERLGGAFTSMVEGAVGVATAYASFSGLKSALLDANKLNASLQVLSKTTGASPTTLRAYGAALESAGGQATDFYNIISQKASEASGARLPILSPESQVQRAFDLIKGLPLAQQKNRLESLGYGGLEPLLLGETQSGLNDKLAAARKRASLDEDAAKAALENQTAWNNLSQSIGTVATEINTTLSGAITGLAHALQGLTDELQGHPAIATGVAATGAAGATWLGWKSVKGLAQWGRSLLSVGAAAGAAESAGAISSAAIAAIIAGGVAATWGAGAAGEAIGRRLSRSAPVNRRAALGGRGESIAFWESQGYSHSQAAGWAANEQAESGYNARAQNGSHVGIFQWSSARRAKILSATGIDVLTASHGDQLKAALWEAQSMGLGPMGLPGNAGAAAAAISNKFEVPSLNPYTRASEAQRRAGVAVKIDEITVNTQAHDANGVASAIGDELKSQLRTLASNMDDGILA